MTAFINIELPRGGHAMLNVAEISSVCDVETYSYGMSVVINLVGGKELTVPHMTVADIKALITKAIRGPGEAG